MFNAIRHRKTPCATPWNGHRRVLLGLAGLLISLQGCDCSGDSMMEPDPTPVASTVNVAVTAGDAANFRVDGTVDVQASAIDNTGSPVASTFTWSSSDPAVATVAPLGSGAQARVTAVAVGAVTISATAVGTTAAGSIAFTTRQPALTEIRVTPVDPSIQLGAMLELTAEAIKQSDGSAATVPLDWTSSDPAIVSVSSNPATGTQAIVVGLDEGTATITAVEPSQPAITGNTMVTVTVTYSRVEVATVAGAEGLDVNAAGDLFTGDGDNTQNKPLRRITPAGVVTTFGTPVYDPDVVIVDRAGSIATLGAGSVLSGGAVQGNPTSRVTEIAPDGSSTRSLFEGPPPDISNPQGFAFLPNGGLLIGNFNNNTVGLLSRDGSGNLVLQSFFAETDVATGMGSLVVHDGVVYARTGARRITALGLTGQVQAQDITPPNTVVPSLLASDMFGEFGNDLLIGALDRRVWRLNTQTGELKPVGDFVFDIGIHGLAVSPVDGALYVGARDGKIWRVTRDRAGG